MVSTDALSRIGELEALLLEEQTLRHEYATQLAELRADHEAALDQLAALTLRARPAERDDTAKMHLTADALGEARRCSLETIELKRRLTEASARISTLHAERDEARALVREVVEYRAAMSVLAMLDRLRKAVARWGP